MNFLFNPVSHFNFANLVTMLNITAGLLATYFITQNQFVVAIILAWLGGIFDIADGKIARKYKLSNEFGIQLDSFADFLSFVLVPVFLIFQAVYAPLQNTLLITFAGIISIYYVISGLRRLIRFNIDSEAGKVARYFVGVPTPLGAILLWIVYVGFSYELLSELFIMISMISIGWLLNSNVKVPHP